MARPVSVLDITPEEQSELRHRVASPTTAQRDSLRAQIVLLRSQGRKEIEVAKTVGASINTVSIWSKRFEEKGLEGLKDQPGRGRKPWLAPEKVRQVITRVTQPPKGKKKWSTRSMAAAVGVSHHSVHTIWRRNDLKPHLLRTFKISSDPQFEPKFWDVIGLYLNPPTKALVLCCDEKSQCQALERTQPGLPLGIGHIRTRTHDYTRHGTVTLFAALNYLDGRILSTTAERHTHLEWLAFLKSIHRKTPPELALHLIVDNYATHKHQVVLAWLEKHPRVHVHFTPTGASWMNLVERFFRQLTDDVVREGSFASVAELITAINVHLAHHNLSPKPYRWKAEGAAILERIRRAREAQANVGL